MSSFGYLAFVLSLINSVVNAANNVNANQNNNNNNNNNNNDNNNNVVGGKKNNANHIDQCFAVSKYQPFALFQILK